MKFKSIGLLPIGQRFDGKTFHSFLGRDLSCALGLLSQRQKRIAQIMSGFVYPDKL